ncbi:DegT/DnrJ/EryC1/StrS family aminotransferase [uncultured Draconibacterium sp.]|uniref:DegT/DnrJ/EryC1/StrS family aminotransferase n=1 Tax=uncultured Draconibacterium sp. TaxID=1573823 RepID=UPI0032166FB9
MDEFTDLLKDIWGRKWLTNNGKYHQDFEKALADYLGVPYISLFSNGTLALISALQVLNITGEVITTPYSFVATTHALWWNNIKPVFVDVEPEFCNLDSKKIEAAITPKTTAILPVHVYGNPCDTEAIQEIADRYGLKVIYDAAHAFGVKQNGQSILNFGDLSILSFHATKVFNTIEGGAIVCHDEKTKKRIDYLKNFGFAGETEVIAPGINAKMNEVQSAFGLLQLKTIDKNILARKEIADFYCKHLDNIDGIERIVVPENLHYNYGYFPVFIDEQKYGMTRDALYEKLKANNIFGRRYFYPLISQFPTYRGLESARPENLPVAEMITDSVICLPIYPDLTRDDLKRILDIILNK